MSEIDQTIQKSLDKLNFQSAEIVETQLKLIESIYLYEPPSGIYALIEILNTRYQNANITPLDGYIYEKLINSDSPKIQQVVAKNFPNGIVTLKSEKNMDYSDLQKLLIQQSFLKADKLTHQKLCQLTDSSRNWLYFTDILKLPIQDLQTIDNLWRIYSNNKFGFSIQKQIWIATQHDWTKFLIKIKWIHNNNLCRYPQEFIWDLSAPSGHLPLFNQLRGTQALNSLLLHKAWEEK